MSGRHTAPTPCATAASWQRCTFIGIRKKRNVCGRGFGHCEGGRGSGELHQGITNVLPDLGADLVVVSYGHS